MTLVPADSPGARPVLVSALQMLHPDQVHPARTPGRAVRMLRSEPPDAALSRHCYQLVGAPWQWVDRVGWSERDWLDWVHRPGHELWTCWVDERPPIGQPTPPPGSGPTGAALAGYYELVEEPGGSVQIAYLGLCPGYSGDGLGGWLLTTALRRAWQLPGARRVWVHTCELDSPAALPNYRARGMVAFRTWTEYRRIPQPAGPDRAPGKAGV